MSGSALTAADTGISPHQRDDMMTDWYYVGLWNGFGYSVDTATVYATDEENAIAKAIVLGCGQMMSPGEYDTYLRWAGITEDEDDQYTYIDCTQEGGRVGYVLMTNFKLRKAEPKDMLGIKGISFYIMLPGGWAPMYFVDGGEFRSALYSGLAPYLGCEVYDVMVQGESYPFGGTLEELMDELCLSDADQIAPSMNRKMSPDVKYRMERDQAFYDNWTKHMDPEHERKNAEKTQRRISSIDKALSKTRRK